VHEFKVLYLALLSGQPVVDFSSRMCHPQYRLKKKKRQYLFYPKSHDSPLARLAEKIELNYCDSDTAFT
jgi:hypothetical protein